MQRAVADIACEFDLRRDRGLGGLLLDACVRRAAELGLPRAGLLVEPESLAVRLYLRSGFREVGTRRVAGKIYLHLTRAAGPAS